MSTAARIYSTKTGKRGRAALTDRIQHLRRHSREDGSAMTRQIALDIRRDTRSNIRESGLIASGILEKSPYIQKISGGADAEYEVGVRAEYAQFPEFGTGRYSLLGGGRQTPWVYLSPTTGEFVTTVGQKPNLFFSSAVQDNMERYAIRIQRKLRERAK